MEPQYMSFEEDFSPRHSNEQEKIHIQKEKSSGTLILSVIFHLIIAILSALYYLALSTVKMQFALLVNTFLINISSFDNQRRGNTILRCI